MKKVGVVTLYTNDNMGNKLQHYAVMQLYRSLGCDAVAVNHMEAELSPEPTLPERITLGIKLAVKVALLRVNPNLRCIQHYKCHLARRRLFLEFTEEYLNPSENVSMRRVPPDLKKRYDFFSVGSDQVWRNWNGTEEELRFFFLQFADRRQRLCLSPSFGLFVSEGVSEKETKIYREYLNSFPRLSCREASGVELILVLTGRDAALLSDPTMALSTADWKHLERKPSYSLPERYVVSYMLGLREETVSRYANLLHMDVVNINDSPPFTEHYAATGPREFLYLIHHASLVCTNSFHGTVFSIIFQRNFVYFNRRENDRGGDINRITTLLDKFHLSSRRYGVLSDEDLLVTDYAGTEETLSRERERILDYLRGALAAAESEDNG